MAADLPTRLRELLELVPGGEVRGRDALVAVEDDARVAYPRGDGEHGRGHVERDERVAKAVVERDARDVAFLVERARQRGEAVALRLQPAHVRVQRVGGDVQLAPAHPARRSADVVQQEDE